MGYKPKLIEVALPLAAINAEAAREKSIRHGHPSTLHLWWARRPLAAARAVIWASLVDDPSGDESLTAVEQEVARARLFGILEQLVKWENSNNPDVLAKARAEIDRCFPDGPPAILDPFAGGGAIPLEAQRLGLRALAGDLNPVATLINKAMIEVPPRFAGRPPVHPDLQGTLGGYRPSEGSEESVAGPVGGPSAGAPGGIAPPAGPTRPPTARSPSAGSSGGAWVRAQGLAADVEAYGQWMRDEAQRRIGHFYPDAAGPNGEKLTPIAWIWARTVESPDPAWSGHVPLVASWVLANKPNKPKVWIEPVIDRETQTISYEIREGAEPTHELGDDAQHGLAGSDEIREGGEPTHERTVVRGNGRCIATGAAIPGDYIKSEGRAGRMGHQLMAVVAEGEAGREYCAPTDADSRTDPGVKAQWQPQASLPDRGLGFRVQPYGLDEWWKLFSPRQLVALTTFSDLLGEVREQVVADALACGFADRPVGNDSGGTGAALGDRSGGPHVGPDDRHPPDRYPPDRHSGGGRNPESAGASAVSFSPDPTDRHVVGPADRHPPDRHSGGGRNPESAGASAVSSSPDRAAGPSGGAAGAGRRLREGGSGAAAYADAVVTYLAFAVDRLADRNSTICTWDSGYVKIRNTFSRQAIPMTWDFAECNPFSDSTGNWMGAVEWIRKALEHLPASVSGEVSQRDARARVGESRGAVVSTDPPYYDNVGYADLSDFFYVWLRRNVAGVWPDECATLKTPKAEEIIADPDRHVGQTGAEVHFESGMAAFMAAVAQHQPAGAPATVYYAYKATETKQGEVRTTGWETFLQAVLDAGLQVNATWPMRTELANRMRGLGSNALASSVVLACRPRDASAPLATRREFSGALRAELPEAVRVLQSGNVSPVDLAQSAIGPGMRVFSRYAKVLEADGSAMRVPAALALVNEVLGEILHGAEAELDAPSRFALAWFGSFGWNPASSGDADNLARAKGTSLGGIAESGIGEARAGEFRLFERSELAPDWTPAGDARLTVWEATQYLVAALGRSEGEASALLRQLGGYGDRARQLAYLLYAKSDEQGWAAEAAAYNTLIAAWPTLRAAHPAAEALTLL
ncbi:MAG: DUF1156 domain-containing protein [bacterium]|nr:DUF1156 domain-containing protein [bacterium]